MKRYLVFAGSCYYPSGGWDDFRGDFDTTSEALMVCDPADFDWWHVVDTATGAQVEAGDSGIYKRKGGSA